jgi:DNA-binding transcriptional ArsR family regulator
MPDNEKLGFSNTIRDSIYLLTLREKVTRNDSISSRIGELLARVAECADPHDDHSEQILHDVACAVRSDLQDELLENEHSPDRSFVRELRAAHEDPLVVIPLIHRIFEALSSPERFAFRDDLDDLLTFLDRAARTWSLPAHLDFTRDHHAILTILMNRGVAMFQVEMRIPLAELQVSSSKSTIGRKLNELREGGFVRTIGERGGQVITSAGREKLEELGPLVTNHPLLGR